jgi:hypothetical protein
LERGAEHRGALAAPGGAQELLLKTMAVKDVVAEDQAAIVRAHEVPTDDKGLGQAAGVGLDGVIQSQAALGAVGQK